MSLIHRVTSIDGQDREFDHHGGTVRSVRRVISYDAFHPTEETPEQDHAHHPLHTVTAYKVSTVKRVAQVAFTVLACWLASGIVFGFAALKPVLVDVGVYRELCTPEELMDDVEVCFEQDLRLNFFFAIASTTCNVSALPVGYCLDRYGPRVCAVLGSAFLAAGALLMGYAFKLPEFDGFVVANVMLALGGTFIFLPSFQIANAFPKYSGTIVATVTGAFDASAAVFLFYRLAYQSSNGAFTPQKFFFGYLAVPVLIFVAQFTIMSPDNYKTMPELEQKLEKAENVFQDVHSSDEELSDDEVRRLRRGRREHRESKVDELNKLIGDRKERARREEHEAAALQTSGVWGALHGKPAVQQMLTPWFILMTALTVLQMLRMNYFIATIRSQYDYMLGSESASIQMNSFFDVALPLGGVLATPVIGILLDSVSTATLLAILVGFITTIGIFGSLPFMWAGYINVILFCLLRPLYYSAMSDYAAKVFGFATFGRVYGTIICFSGLVNLFQPAIDAMSHEVFHDNPLPLNTLLAGLAVVIGTVLVLYVIIQGRKVMKEHAVEDAETASILQSIAEDESEYGTF